MGEENTKKPNGLNQDLPDLPADVKKERRKPLTHHHDSNSIPSCREKKALQKTSELGRVRASWGSKKKNGKKKIFYAELGAE